MVNLNKHTNWKISDGDYSPKIPANHRYQSGRKIKIMNNIAYSIVLLSGLMLFYFILTLVEQL